MEAVASGLGCTYGLTNTQSRHGFISLCVVTEPAISAWLMRGASLQWGHVPAADEDRFVLGKAPGARHRPGVRLGRNVMPSAWLRQQKFPDRNLLPCRRALPERALARSVRRDLDSVVAGQPNEKRCHHVQSDEVLEESPGCLMEQAIVHTFPASPYTSGRPVDPRLIG